MNNDTNVTEQSINDADRMLYVFFFYQIIDIDNYSVRIFKEKI